MKTLEAKFQIVTPMFLCGAENIPELRAPSIKGALRFWWRALNWGLIRQKTSSDKEALCLLHQMEGEIFGSAAVGQQRQSSFLLKIIPGPMKPPVTDWPDKVRDVNGSGYMGLGLWGTGTTPQRNGLQEKTNFSVVCRFKPSTDPCVIKSVKDALTIFGLLGGLGSRVRRAFGSVALSSLDEQDFGFQDLSRYKAELKELLRVYPPSTTRPPYTAFGAGYSVRFFSFTSKNARKMHKEIAVNYKSFRSSIVKKEIFQRCGFGMPLKPYEERRSSPLMFHIHPVADYFVGAALYLPSTFHHDNKFSTVGFEKIEEYIHGMDALR